MDEEGVKRKKKKAGKVVVNVANCKYVLSSAWRSADTAL